MCVSTRMPSPAGHATSVTSARAGTEIVRGILGVDAALDRAAAAARRRAALKPQARAARDARSARRRGPRRSRLRSPGAPPGCARSSRGNRTASRAASTRNSTVPAPRYDEARREAHRGVVQPATAGFRRQSGRGRLLDQLLIATLHRAVALAEMDDTRPSPSPSTCTSTWRRAGHEPLEIHARIAECGARLRRRRAPSRPAGPRVRRPASCRGRRRRPTAFTSSGAADAHAPAPRAASTESTAPPGTTGTCRVASAAARAAACLPTASICAAVGPMNDDALLLAQARASAARSERNRSPDGSHPPSRPARPARWPRPSDSCRPARPGPMHNVRSASRAGSESRSASDAASTVSMPSARQVRMIRTAISPRFAMRMRRMLTARPSLRTRSSVSPYSTSAPSRAQDLAHRAAHACTHGVHELHHFDDADDGVVFHGADPTSTNGGAPGFGAR